MHLLKTALGIVVATSFCGCEMSPPEPPPPPAFRVKGRLFVNDQMAARASIAFCPVDQLKSQGRCPVAMTQRDGSFELTTYTSHDGAPAGDYRVTVFWPDDSMPEDECECINPLQHDRLGGNYADPATTSLMVTVLPRDNFVNLTAEGGKRSGTPGLALPRESVDRAQ